MFIFEIIREIALKQSNWNENVYLSLFLLTIMQEKIEFIRPFNLIFVLLLN